MTTEQQRIRNDIVTCLADVVCAEYVKLITDFMNAFDLWDKLINTEGKLEEEIHKFDNSISKSIIHKIYGYVKNDLNKHYKIKIFTLSMNFVKGRAPSYHKHLSHHLNIIENYKGIIELKTPSFRFKPIRETKIVFDSSALSIVKSNWNVICAEIDKIGPKIKIIYSLNMDDAERKELLLKTIELIRFQTDSYSIILRNSDLIDEFINKCPGRIDIISRCMSLIFEKIQLQKDAVEYMSSFFDIYHNANFMHAWDYMKNIINAFSTQEIQKFDIEDLKIIFYDKFTKSEELKFDKLKKLFDEYNDNYERIKMKEIIIKDLKVNSLRDNVNFGIFGLFLGYYGIDSKTIEYAEFRNIFMNKDKIIVEKDTILLFKYYSKYILYRERTTAMNTLYEKIIANQNIHIVKVYENVANIVNMYQIKNKAISYNDLHDRVKNYDHVVNELVLISIHPFVVKYLLLEERMKIISLLMFGFKKYSHSVCFFTAKDFEIFFEVYEINKIKNFEEKTIYNYFFSIDMNFISLAEIEYLVKYLLKCQAYQMRKQITRRLRNFLNNNNVQPYVFSAVTEKYIKVYRLTDYDVKNYHNFIDKVKMIDEFVQDENLEDIYRHVSIRMKYSKKTNLLLNLLEFIKKSTGKLQEVIIELEDIISGFDIKLYQLNTVQDLKNLLAEFERVIIEKEIEIIYETLTKYRNFLRRKNYLLKLISYLKKDHKITDITMSLYMNRVITEYKLNEKDVTSKTAFINLMTLFDEIFDKNDIDLLHRKIIEYLEIYNRKSIYENATKYIEENKKFKFIHLSSYVKKYVDSYKFTLDDVSTFDNFVEKVKRVDGIFDEKKLKILYEHVLNHIGYRKIQECLRLIKNTVLSGKSENLIKLSSCIDYIIPFYNLNEDTLANFVIFFKTVKEKSGEEDESLFAIAYQKVKYHFESKLIKIYKTEYIKYKSDKNAVYLKEKYLEKIIKTYSLANRRFRNIVEFQQIVKTMEYVPLNKETNELYNEVSGRVKFHDLYK